MARRRPSIPKATEKRIYQQAQSQCPFCDESEVTALQIHHIDGDPSNNDFDNLILTCASCHAKITAGLIFKQKVVQTKLALPATSSSPRSRTRPEMNVSISGSSVRGDVANVMTKITTSKSVKTVHPPGSIGADLKKKGYIDYLIGRYYELRKADPSYGRQTKFSHAVIHRNIQREFGCKTFFVPAEHFDALARYLQSKIDGTIQGKRNLANGHRDYHSPHDHVAGIQQAVTKRSKPRE